MVLEGCAHRRGVWEVCVQEGCVQVVAMAPLAPPTFTNVQHSILDSLFRRAVMINAVEDLVLRVTGKAYITLTFTPHPHPLPLTPYPRHSPSP